MKSKRTRAILTMAGALAVLGGTAVIAQDEYSLKIPDGLAFSEFRGYEAWQVASVSHPTENADMSGEVLNVIVANPVMIDAYAAGIPGNGKPFPDGAKAAKIQYVPKKSAEAPFSVSIPDNYDPASDGFKPDGTGAACGFECHAVVSKKDYVFTAYEKS